MITLPYLAFLFDTLPPVFPPQIANYTSTQIGWFNMTYRSTDLKWELNMTNSGQVLSASIING